MDLQQTIDKVTNYQYLPMLKKVCYQYVWKATKELKNMIRIHRDLRHQSLTILQELRKAQGIIPTAEIIQKIIRTELHDQDLAIIKAIKNPKIPSPPSKQEDRLNKGQAGSRPGRNVINVVIKKDLKYL
jgi:hypothetical protein